MPNNKLTNRGNNRMIIMKIIINKKIILNNQIKKNNKILLGYRAVRTPNNTSSKIEIKIIMMMLIIIRI